MEPIVCTLLGIKDMGWCYLDKLGTLLGVVTGVISVTLPVLAYFKRESLRRFFTRNRFPRAGGLADAQLRLGGIVFTVSHEDTPRWVIERMKPLAVGFICTGQSRTVVDHLSAFARSIDVTHVLSPMVIDNPDNVIEARSAAAALLDRMREAGAGSLAVDVTGGKTPMSIGAFMAAEEAGVSSIYVTSPFDPQLRKPDMTKSQIICISQPR
jgi:hypothetical protein